MCVFRLLLLLLAGLFSAQIAGAQPGHVTHRSLEGRIAQAPSVFRGTISNLTRLVVVPPNGFETNVAGTEGNMRPYTTQWPNRIVTFAITVKIDEVLKGSPSRTVELVARTDAYDKQFDQWAEQHTSIL